MPASSADIADEALAGCRLARARQARDREAPRGQLRGDGRADAARRAGDDDVAVSSSMNLGLRFSSKAAVPSAASLVWKASVERSASIFRPSWIGTSSARFTASRANASTGRL